MKFSFNLKFVVNLINKKIYCTLLSSRYIDSFLNYELVYNRFNDNLRNCIFLLLCVMLTMTATVQAQEPGLIVWNNIGSSGTDISSGVSVTDISGTGIDIDISFPDPLDSDVLEIKGFNYGDIYKEDDEPFNLDSFFRWYKEDNTNSTRYAYFSFSEKIQYASFRINQIDGFDGHELHDQVEVRAFNGNIEVPVVVTPGTSDNPIVTSQSPATVSGDSNPTNSHLQNASALFTILAPADRFEIGYTNLGVDDRLQSVTMTDIAFKSIPDFTLTKSASFNESGFVDNCGISIPTNSILENGSFEDPSLSAGGTIPQEWGEVSTPNYSTSQTVQFNAKEYDFPVSSSNESTDFEGPSPNGGSFIGVRYWSNNDEGVRQEVNITDADQEYTLQLWYSEFNFPGRSTPNANQTALALKIGGEVIGTFANANDLDENSGAWNERSISFIPADKGIVAGSHDLEIVLVDGDENRFVFFDGVVFGPKSLICRSPQAGDDITYTFKVENTGSDVLNSLTITDNLPGLSAISFDFTNSTATNATTINPGEVAVFNATYSITQSDINAGYIENSATANANGPNGTALPPVTSDTGTNPDGTIVTQPYNTDTNADGSDIEDPTKLIITQNPDFTLIKTMDNSGLSDPVQEGEQIDYTFTVENTGNVNIENVLVTDDLAGLSALTFNSSASTATDATVVAPGEVAVFNATYSVTTADITAGSIQNSATAFANEPGGIDLAPVTSDTGTNADGSDITDPLNIDSNGDGVADSDPTFTTLDVLQRDLEVTMEISNESPLIGDPVYFNIDATNKDLTTSDDGVSKNIKIDINIPAEGYEIDSFTAGKGTYDPETGIWTIDELAADQTTNLLVKARIKRSELYQVAGEQPYLSSASIAFAIDGLYDEPDLTNNDADVNPAPVTDVCFAPEGFNRLTNGGFDLDENDEPHTTSKRNYAPDGWTKLETPDLSVLDPTSSTGVRVRFNDISKIDLFGPSPQGGAFMGFRNSGKQEGFEQEVTIDDPDVELAFLFWYTEYTQPGKSADPEDQAMRLQVGGETIKVFDNLIDTGAQIDENDDDITNRDGEWELRWVTFKPSEFGLGAGNHKVTFTETNSSFSRWSFVDGVALSPAGASCSPVANDAVDSKSTPLGEPVTFNVADNDLPSQDPDQEVTREIDPESVRLLDENDNPVEELVVLRGDLDRRSHLPEMLTFIPEVLIFPKPQSNSC